MSDNKIVRGDSDTPIIPHTPQPAQPQKKPKPRSLKNPFPPATKKMTLPTFKHPKQSKKTK